MVKIKKELNIFIASPGDVPEERNIVRKVCEDLNKSTLLEPYGISFKVTGWEDALPSAGRPQAIINQLVNTCDIFICIFHKRFGSPTGKAESGTLEEFLLAWDLWKFLKDVKTTSLKDLEDPQLRKVLELKEKIEQEKILLFCAFATPDEFREKIKDHLQKRIIKNAKGWERIDDRIERQYEEGRIFSAYLQSALLDHRHLTTQGFETNLRVPIELENVYINMKAKIHTHDFEFNLKERKKREERTQEESLSSLDIKTAFEAAYRHKVKDMVILGDPGSGKTTLLKYILVVLIEGKGREKLGIETPLIPFLAPLRELKEPDREPFPGFITRVCKLGEYSISDDSLKKLLDNGRGIILLDGLDEVADEKTRIQTCKWIDGARRRFAKSPFIITSRYAGYIGKSRLEGNIIELSVQDFTPDEVKEFLVKWFETVEAALHPGGDEARWKKKGREEAMKLFERIRKAEHISKLAVNPLLLQIIALVHRDRGALPQRRVELYNECTNVLLEKWDMAKGLDVLLSARQARQILQPLALWLHGKDERRSAPMGEIKAAIQESLEEIGKSDIDPEKLFLNIRDRSGIFIGYSETEYGFTHLSFQEYLSAEQIRNKGQIDTLIQNYTNRWWKEVILLCLALLAFEALETLGVSEGVVKPTVKEVPSRLINPVDDSEMVLIPAGTFLYGSRENDPVANSDEKPQRVIDLHSFYMDIYPVTYEQYRNFLQTIKPDKDTLIEWIDLKGSYQEERCRIKKDGKDYTIEEGYEKYPVIYVSWHGADAYAKWAGKRLPTEQEWEKAARGPDGWVYPWGDTFDAALCNSAESRIGGTTEVDKFPKGKSYYGCYDIAGNVWEWTDSWYDDKKTYRVLRGGSWLNVGNFCRCANRYRINPVSRIDNVGSRCARTLTL